MLLHTCLLPGTSDSMIKIYARSTRIGEEAYSAVAALGTEKAYGAEGFIPKYIEITDPRAASFILDGHIGSGNAKVYIHAAEDKRMPPGLVRAAFKSHP